MAGLQEESNGAERKGEGRRRRLSWSRACRIWVHARIQLCLTSTAPCSRWRARSSRTPMTWRRRTVAARKECCRSRERAARIAPARAPEYGAYAGGQQRISKRASAQVHADVRLRIRINWVHIWQR